MGSSSSDSEDSSRRDRRQKRRERRSRSRERRSSSHKKGKSRKSSKGRRDRDSKKGRDRGRRDRRQRESRSPSHDKNKSSTATLKEIEATKNRMKEALIAAKQSSSSCSLLSSSNIKKEVVEENASEMAARQRAIERIDSEGAFVPQSFKSTSGANRNSQAISADLEEKQIESQHEGAIFGAVSDVKSENLASESSTTAVGSDSVPLAHENLFEDRKIREERWLRKWREMRARLKVS